jgi:transposase
LPNDWILRHDNAPAHKAISVKQFLAQELITEMEHSSYSPDLTSNDLWLFPKIKSTLKGQIFQDIENIQKKYDEAEQEFQKCFQQWQHC